MNRHQFNATVVAGRLQVAHASYLREILAAWEGKEIRLTIERKKAKRSNNQNAYYWGVVAPLVRQGLTGTGCAVGVEETHEILKDTFCRVEVVNEQTGEVYSYAGSTTDLGRSDFADFIDAVQRWAAEYLDTIIPAPGEQLTIDK